MSIYQFFVLPHDHSPLNNETLSCELAQLSEHKHANRMLLPGAFSKS